MAAHWSLSAEQPRAAGHHEISEALRQFEHRQRSLISGTFRVEASARLHNPAETHESHAESGSNLRSQSVHVAGGTGSTIRLTGRLLAPSIPVSSSAFSGRPPQPSCRICAR